MTPPPVITAGQVRNPGCRTCRHQSAHVEGELSLATGDGAHDFFERIVGLTICCSDRHVTDPSMRTSGREGNTAQPGLLRALDRLLENGPMSVEVAAALYWTSLLGSRNET